MTAPRYRPLPFPKQLMKGFPLRRLGPFDIRFDADGLTEHGFLIRDPLGVGELLLDTIAFTQEPWVASEAATERHRANLFVYPDDPAIDPQPRLHRRFYYDEYDRWVYETIPDIVSIRQTDQLRLQIAPDAGEWTAGQIRLYLIVG